MPARVSALMRAAITETSLDLTGLSVLTEAATGAYAVTPVIAALAGAHPVYAFARENRYGSATDAFQWTGAIAAAAGVADRITFIETIPSDLPGRLDIVTNSGNLRPITADLIGRLPAGAVIALMFEAWEFRAEDIDLPACRRHGIPVVGVNERHPTVDVFSYLGPLCVKLLHDAGVTVYGNRIAVLCDNDFGPPILHALDALGADVRAFAAPSSITAGQWDAIVVALQPRDAPRIDAAAAARIAASAPGAILAQFWGDIDRQALTEYRVPVWPPAAPRPGHMAVLLSDIGPDPILRLQTGGLRAAEWVHRGGQIAPDGIAQRVE